MLFCFTVLPLSYNEPTKYRCKKYRFIFLTLKMSLSQKRLVFYCSILWTYPFSLIKISCKDSVKKSKVQQKCSCSRDEFRSVSFYVKSCYISLQFQQVWVGLRGGLADICCVLFYFRALCSRNEHMFPLIVTSICFPGSFVCYYCSPNKHFLVTKPVHLICRLIFTSL